MLSEQEPGLIRRLRSAGIKPCPRSLTPVIGYLFRHASGSHREALAALKEAGGDPQLSKAFLSEWLTRNSYPLHGIRRAIRRLVLGRVTFAQAAWQHKVWIGDLQHCMKALHPSLRAELEKRPYWKPISRRSEGEIHRLLTRAAERQAYRKTRFLWQARFGEAADPSLTKEDIVAELMMEVGRVLRLYDFDPTRHSETFEPSVSAFGISRSRGSCRSRFRTRTP